jgi:hypothetical protein
VIWSTSWIRRSACWVKSIHWLWTMAFLQFDAN